MTESYLLLSYDGIAEDDNKYYGSSSCFNGLIEIDRATGKAEIIRKFPQEQGFAYLLHHKLYRNENEIIFAPDGAKVIHIMDIISKKISCVDFMKDKNNSSKCIDSYVWKNKLWLFFSDKKIPIISMNLYTHEIEYYPKLTRPLEKIITDQNVFFFCSELWKERENIYGAIYNSEYFVHINLDRMNTEIFSVAPVGKQLADIVVDGQIAYLTELDSYGVIAYSFVDKSVKKYEPEKLTDLKDGSGYIYSKILAANGNVILIPNYDDRILCLRDGIIVWFENMPAGYRDIIEDGRADWRRFYSSEIQDGIIRLFPAKSNMILEIDVVQRRISGNSYSLNPDWINTAYYPDYVNSYIRESVQDKLCMYENKVVDLKDYVRILCARNEFGNES